jgi:hypothetical protein
LQRLTPATDEAVYFDHKLTIMKQTRFSFQVYLPGMDTSLPWDSVKPVVHVFDSYDIGIAAAYALSLQLSKATVRIVELTKTWDGTNSMIGRMSGTYLQAA